MKFLKNNIAISVIGLLLGTGLLLLMTDYFNTERELDDHEEMEEGSLMGRVMGRFQQEWLMTHDPATGKVPRERLLNAYRKAQELRLETGSRSGVIPLFWAERGPNNVGGRTRGLLIDATDATGRTVWAAGISGGLWRCNNIDAVPPVWANINDFFSNLAISTIAQDPSNPNIMYFGTGENGFGNFDAVQGMGIWRSTDGGNTWNQMISTLTPIFQSVNKILVDNGGVVWAATTNGLFTLATPGGAWTKVLGIGAGATGDLVQDFEFAANGDVYAGINGVGLFRFQAGVWAQLTDPNIPTTGFARVELATAPSNAAVVYAAFATTISMSQSTCLTVISSGDSGGSWTARTCPMNLGVFCWYAYVMAVDPTNPARIWIGDVNLFVSGDNGMNWTQAMNVHADHHALVYRPGSATDMVFGNDGGVYRSTNANAANPTLLAKNDGYNVTQFYANALHPTAGTDYILGGTQDNGTQRFTCVGMCATDMPTGNDGAFCFVDQDNPMIQVTGSQNRLFFVSNDGGASFNTLLPGDNGTLFITPAEYDSGGDILYFSDGNDTLGRVSGVGAANTVTFENITQMGNARMSIATISPNTPNRLFMGVTNGRLLRIDNAQTAGGITVTQLTSPFTTFVSSIAVEVGNDMHLLATAPNYGINSIFESIDGGTTWTSVEGTLPDMPVRWAMFHPADPDQALIATELGVWSTDDLNGTATEWFPTNTFGLANVRVDMLQYRASDNLVAAATHGRGMYTTDYFNLLETCPASLMVGGNIAPGLYMADDFITSDGTVQVGRSVVFHAGNRINLLPDFHAELGSFFVASIQECGPGSGPLIADNPNMTELPPPNPSPPTASMANQPSLTCSPNPASYQLSVRLEVPADTWYQLYVKNLQGQLVGTICPGAKAAEGAAFFELDAGRFAPGMYVLILQTKEGAVSEKFVVAR
jgi:trimeric autotransporter adhesin